MRKVNSSIDDIIDKIKNLQGKNIDLEITRGRKKTQKISGVIENIYPSIFTIRDTEKNSFSYSYADVLCGVVNLKNTINEEYDAQKLS